MITLPPFKEFLASNIPSVYDNTLSYYDELTKLIAYLEQQVVPAVNETTVGLKVLKEYVEHYFDNLDIQEEINNKLDEMAGSGQLAEIVALYADLPCIHAYATISDMASSDNLSNGSYARAMSKTIAGTGDGFYYYIRTKTPADIPDGENIVAIGASLVGIKIPNPLDSVVANLVEDVAELQDAIQDTLVVFGDSWSDLNVEQAVWSSYVANELGLTNKNYAVNGAGFVAPNTNLINTQITTAENDSTLNKDRVKYVVLAGGINDFRNDVLRSDLRTAIGAAYTRCRALFPNAKIIYVNNFQYPYTDAQSVYWYKLQTSLSSDGVIALNQDGYFRKAYFLNNLYHLTTYGQHLFGRNIAAALSGGDIINEGVEITLDDNKGTIYMKRDEAMIHYVFKLTNLSASANETLTTTSGYCWVNSFKAYGLVGGIGWHYTNFVIETNDNYYLLAKNDVDAENLSTSGSVK